MKVFSSVACFVFFSLFLISCGGGASDNYTGKAGELGQRLSVLAPEDGATFKPGDKINFALQTENFSLREPSPVSHSPSSHSTGHSHSMENDGVSAHNHKTFKHHVGPDGVNLEELRDAAEKEGLVEVASSRLSKNGHFHVYLNELVDSDPHLTSWNLNPEYQLPDDIPEGFHSLRFELRDDLHQKVGSESIYFFEVVK